MRLHGIGLALAALFVAACQGALAATSFATGQASLCVTSPHGEVPAGARAYAPEGYYAQEIGRGRGQVGIFDDAGTQVGLIDARQNANPLKAVCFSADGSKLAVMFHHHQGGFIAVYDAASQSELGRVPIRRWYHAMTFGDDGISIVAEGDVIPLPFLTTSRAAEQSAALPDPGATVTPPAPPAPPPPPSTTPAAEGPFVTRRGTELYLNGAPFRFGGANNYYLTYKSPAMVDDLLRRAVAMDLRVLRIWAFLDRGSLDGTVANVDGPGEKDGVYFQYFDPQAGRPAYNDGADGLARLDYVVARSEQLGLKLILVLTNNWPEFGGMDQLVTFYGLPHHDDFYRDERVRQAYQAYAAHLIGRQNTVTGRPFRDDPTIMSWQLANEPRCRGDEPKPTSGSCTPETITRWAAEMSAFIKRLDPNHLVSVGDEGFFNRPGQSDWTMNGSEGVDHDALLALPTVDFGTFHLYPDRWEKHPSWGVPWIDLHLAAARAADKPVILEEFGSRDPATRDALYGAWTEALRTGGGNGFLFWMLAGDADDGSPYPDYDGLRVLYPSTTATVLQEAARRIAQTASGISEPVRSDAP